MKNHQLGAPHIFEGGAVHKLHRVEFDERDYSENHLQSLLFDNPCLLPAADIEPVFRELLSVCRELPTPAGPLDLVYITPNGDLCLVETKLWRNHEARRKVVAQIIDYAKEIAGWSYEDLLEAIGRSAAVAQPANATEEDLDPLAAMVADESGDFEQQAFIDAVSRNLRLGRFLLLIVGDGIREDVEKITDFLQQTPNLGYTFGLIEIGLYRLPGRTGDELLFQPRTLCKTVNIERAVVEIRNHADPNLQIEVKLPTQSKKSAKKTSRSSMTEDAYLEALEENASPEAVAVAREVLDKVGEYGIDLTWGTSGPMMKYETAEAALNFGQFSRNGKLVAVWRLSISCHNLGLDQTLAREYHDFLASLLPGSKVYEGLNHLDLPMTDVRTGPRFKIDRPDISALAGKVDQWLSGIVKFGEKFESEIERLGGDG